MAEPALSTPKAQRHLTTSPISDDLSKFPSLSEPHLQKCPCRNAPLGDNHTHVLSSELEGEHFERRDHIL